MPKHDIVERLMRLLEEHPIDGLATQPTAEDIARAMEEYPDQRIWTYLAAYIHSDLSTAWIGLMVARRVDVSWNQQIREPRFKLRKSWNPTVNSGSRTTN